MNIKKALLLGVVALCTRMRTSTHTGPMLRINCPIFQPPCSALASPKYPFFPPPIYTCKHLLTMTTSTCLFLLLLSTVTTYAGQYKASCDNANSYSCAFVTIMLKVPTSARGYFCTLFRVSVFWKLPSAKIHQIDIFWIACTICTCTRERSSSIMIGPHISLD